MNTSDQQQPRSAGAEQRVGLVEGARACAHCGFDLFGQSVVREQHYQVLIVRCPECGTVAAVQEYPALGVWAKRLAALLLAAWVGLLIVGVIVIAITLNVLTAWAVALGSVPLADTISHRYAAWHSDMAERYRDDPNRASSLSQYPYLLNNLMQANTWSMYYVDAGWWKEQNKAELIEQSGGVSRALMASGSAVWVVFGLVAFAVGAVMAVALLHLARWKVVLCAVLPIGVGAFTLSSADANISLGGGIAQSSMALAQWTMWASVGSIAFAFYVLCLIAGIFAGRPLARAIVRGTVPPRLRGPLAFLWTAKGLPPPRTRQ